MASASGDRFGDDPRWRWLTFSPALAMMLCLSVLPLANLFLVSFQDITWVDGGAVRTGVGLANYAALPDDTLFRAGIVNTFIFAFVAVSGQMVLGFALASQVSAFWQLVCVYAIAVPVGVSAVSAIGAAFSAVADGISQKDCFLS